MRELSSLEIEHVGAGSMTENFSAIGSEIQTFIKKDIFIGAIGVALLMSPISWSMTAVGAIVGASLGIAFDCIKERLI